MSQSKMHVVCKTRVNRQQQIKQDALDVTLLYVK